ncbi:ABC transporter permease [candidate division KSB1 bacterium]
MKSNEPKLPFFASMILKIFNRRNDGFSLSGDIEEEFYELAELKGEKYARKWYRRNMLRSVPLIIRDTVYWRFTMFKNYLKIALRNVRKQKIYSLIIFSGLSLGFACCLILVTYIRFELSYDGFHKKSDRIFRVVQENNAIPGSKGLFAITPAPLASTLKHDFPEVQSSARIYKARNLLLQYGDKKFIENEAHFVDPEFFDIFSFPLVNGDYENLKTHTNTLFISERAAKKFFGDDSPLGKIINVENQDDFIIGGVMKNFPGNSHLQMDFVFPFSVVHKRFKSWLKDMNVWWHIDYYTYILLADGAVPALLEKKFPEMIMTYSGDSPVSPKNQGVRYFLQPLTDIHIHNHLGEELGTNNNIKNIILFGTVAALILLIACFNQINLSTARSAYRNKEIGMRKIIGADRSSLIRQFLGESFVMVFLSACFSILLVRIFLPYFNRIMDIQLKIGLSAESVRMFLLLILLTGFLSGLYPAFFLSSFKPVHNLKSSFSTRKKGGRLFRNVLVTGQFVMSISLIACTFAVQHQLNFIRNKDLGYNRNHVVVLRINDQNVRNNPAEFISELKKYSSIKETTVSQHLPSQITTNNFPDWNSKPDNLQVSCLYGQIDEKFIDFYNMKLVEGEVIRERFNPRKGLYAYINQSALKAFGWEKAAGRRFSFLGNEWTTAGVIRDFHSRSLHESITPVVLLYIPFGSFVSVKVEENNIPAAISYMEKVWKEFMPAFPFNYSFLKEDINRLYKSEQREGQIFSIFTFVSIFIACLGLIGLAYFTIGQKTKEIGVRKVMGATVTRIFVLLSREFAVKIFIANIIALPAAYYFMNKWLQNFAYRIELSIWIFILSGLAAFCIALLTISFQTIKAALANPVDSLRNE